MIHFAQKFATSLALLSVAFVLTAPLCSAQDRFVGDGQAVNRVIKLRTERSTGVDSAHVANEETFRGNRVTGQLNSIASPSDIQFDEIQFDDIRAPRASAEIPSSANHHPIGDTSEFNQINSSKSMMNLQPDTSHVLEPLENVTITNHQMATEVRAPSMVNVNQPTKLRITIYNNGEEKVESVRLVATLPPHARFVSATPRPAEINGQEYVFVVTQLEGMKPQEVTINVVPTKKLPLELATQVFVEDQQRMVVNVYQPLLKLDVTGPEQTTTGKNVNHVITLTNVGDGVAKNVKLESVLPAQLQLSNSRLGETIPFIHPGQALDFHLNSRALTPGKGQLKVTANSQSTKSEQTSIDLVVFQPELRLSAAGPKINFVARDGIYTINVENTGEVEVNNVNVSLTAPEGMEVITISRQADVDAETGTLTWKYDRLAAKTNEQIQLKATSRQEGEQVCRIRINSDEIVDKEFLLATQVATRADVSVRITNKTGPVQVGAKAEFLVEVENHGSRQANDVSIMVDLPESLMPVRGKDNQVNALVFDQSLIAPGQNVTFKFTAVGISQGDHVVRSTLQMGGTERKVIAEDSVYVFEVDQTRVSESLSPVIPR